MIIVKKEYLEHKQSPYKIPLGELNQNSLKDIQDKYGNKFFEVKTPKKKKDDTGD
jgi:hypothetical protein